MIWNLDHAASGDRYRAFPEDGWELIVYVTGEWLVRGVPAAGEGARPGCDGWEHNLEAGKARAIRVYEAMRSLL